MAFSMEFITHGGFEIVRDSWLFISNIMSASDYRSLITAVFLMSMVLSAISGTLNGIYRTDSMTSWMKAGLIAILMYACFFQTGFGSWHLNGRLVIYDDIKNKHQVISNLPVGLVALAGMTNKVQTGMEDLVQDIITGPYIQDTSEVAIGVKMLREASEGRLKAILYSVVPEEVKRSIYYYMDQVASVVATADATVKARIEHTNDLISAFGNACNRALYTRTWLNGSGNIMSTDQVVDGCTAWDRIKAYLTNTSSGTSTSHLPDVIKKFCMAFGFDSGGVSYQACRNILENTATSFVGAGVTTITPEKLAASVLLRARWLDYLRSLDSSIALSSVINTLQSKQSSLTGSAIAAEQWLPHIKNVMTALLIGLVPIIMLFIATTAYMRAVTLLFGLFVWLLIWTVADKILEGFWISYAQQIWNATQGLGVKDQEIFWANASQTLSVLGGMRSMGMMLSGIITYGIFQFGGSMFAHMVSGAMGTIGAESAATGEALRLDNKADYSLATQTASSYQDYSYFSNMTPSNYMLYGAAKAAQQQISGGTYGSMTKNQTQFIGRQAYENAWAKAMGDSTLSLAQKQRAATYQAQRSYSKTERAKMAEDKYGLDMATAQRLLHGEMTLGQLSLNNEKRVLDDLFGKGSSKKLEQKYGTDIFKDFGSLKIHGIPGQIVTANGVVGKRGLQAIGDLLAEKKLYNAARGFYDAANRGPATINATGSQTDGLAIISESQGAETRLFDLENQKRYIERSDISYAKDKDFVDNLEKIAKRTNNMELMAAVKAMKSHPDKTYEMRITGSMDNPSKIEMKRGSKYEDLTDRMGQSEQVKVMDNKGIKATLENVYWRQKGNHVIMTGWNPETKKMESWEGIGSVSASGRFASLKGIKMSAVDESYKYRGDDIKMKVGEKVISGLSGEEETIGDYVRFRGAMNASQLEILQEELKNMGKVSSASALSKYIQSGQSVDTSLVTKNGQIVGLKVGNDVLVSEKDLATSDKGSRSWEGDRVERDFTYAPIESGRSYLHSESANAEVSKEFAKDVVHGLPRHSRGEIIQGQISSLVKATEEIAKKEGDVMSSFNLAAGGEGALTLREESDKQFLGWLYEKFTGISGSATAKAGVNVNVDRKNVEKLMQNLLYLKYALAYREAMKAATIGGQLRENVFREELWKRTHNIFNSYKNLVSGKVSDFNYGASALFAEPLNLIKSAGEKMTGKDGKFTIEDLANVANKVTDNILAPGGREIANILTGKNMKGAGIKTLQDEVADCR